MLDSKILEWIAKIHQTSNVIRSSSEKLVLTIKIASTQSLIINSKRGIVVGILNFTDSLCSSSIACRRLVAPISEQIGLFIKFHSKTNFGYYTYCWFDKWSLSLPLSVSKQCGVYLITGMSTIMGRWHVIYHLRTVFITRVSFTACTQNVSKLETATSNVNGVTLTCRKSHKFLWNKSRKK